MATQTFLNEQESAAMPGMSSLPTMLACTPGTCVKAFHTVHRVCHRERRRLRIYCRIFVDIPYPSCPLKPLLRQTALLLTKAALCQGQWREFAQARQMHTSSVRTEGGGEEEGVTKKLVKKDFETKSNGCAQGPSNNPNRATIETKGTKGKTVHLSEHNIICVFRAFSLFANKSPV